MLELHRDGRIEPTGNTGAGAAIWTAAVLAMPKRRSLMRACRLPP